MQLRSFSTPALLALFLTTLVSAYRPLQFVKHTGESGRADQAFSLVNYYNAETQQSDLYVRMEAFRYQSSAKGWAALGLGPQMKGALMFIIYGDPAGPDNELTLTIRTVDGHHPPRPLEEMTDFYGGPVPEIDIVSTRFEEYTGDFVLKELNQKPSHLGIAEFIVRGFDQWAAADLPVTNDTAAQAMIWSSNFKQDFEDDFSPERNIDMHQFGLGFGFLWADLLNAASPEPFFGPINELDGHLGVSETGDPDPPTGDELEKGEGVIFLLGDGGSSDKTEATPDEADKQSSTETPGADDGNRVEEPVKTVKQWNIRSWMWHIHGFLMTLGFLVLYPLGIYLLRSNRPTAFNLHWTMNSLGSVSVGIGAIVGFVNSRSISIAHQYLGILLVCGLAVQTVLGWRHHVVYVATHGNRTWMSTVHVILGRVVLPLGMLNIITGLLRRDYGWLIVSLTLALAVVEIVALTLFVGRARNRRLAGPGGPKGIGGARGNAVDPGMPGDEAEEYFQLTGEDDDEDDAFADLDDDDDADPEAQKKRAQDRARKEQEREEQRARLAKLDRV